LKLSDLCGIRDGSASHVLRDESTEFRVLCETELGDTGTRFLRIVPTSLHRTRIGYDLFGLTVEGRL
jgi:hypothetical protein